MSCKGYKNRRTAYDMRTELFAESMEELAEKRMLLGVLQDAMDSLLPEERELAMKVFGEDDLWRRKMRCQCGHAFAKTKWHTKTDFPIQSPPDLVS